MITLITKECKRFWERWAKKRNRFGNPQSLNSHNLYVLPSGFGWAYGFMVVILLIGSINYQINTIFLMTFLLVIIGIVSAWEAHENLKNLSIKFLGVEDAQQGTPAKILLFIEPNSKSRFGIEFQITAQVVTRVEKIPSTGLQFIIPIETIKRGCFPIPRITLSSLYPFGIFRVWSYLYFDEYYYVYPQAIDPGIWPEPWLDASVKNRNIFGEEEFFDLKQVENPWLEPKRIAWRIAAKNQGWYLKTMNSNTADYWLFTLAQLPEKDHELQLQNISYWLQTADAKGHIYSLELAELHTQFSRGQAHLAFCLRQLALYR